MLEAVSLGLRWGGWLSETEPKQREFQLGKGLLGHIFPSVFKPHLPSHSMSSSIASWMGVCVSPISLFVQRCFVGLPPVTTISTQFELEFARFFF